MSKNKQITKQFVVQLNDHSLSTRDQLEILANTFIQLGFAHLPGSEDSVADAGSAMAALAEHKATHGESIGTALVQQGLLLMMWIENIESNKERG